MVHNPLYNDFAAFLKQHFTCKVQKISINAGFTCLIGTVPKVREAALTATTRLLIPNTATPTSRYAPSWKKETILFV